MISAEANNILIQIENISSHINDLNKRLCSLERVNKDFTLCGFCNERVPSNSLHSCSVIRNIKDKIDYALTENSELIKALISNVNKLMEKVFEPCLRINSISYDDLLKENEYLKYSNQLLDEHLARKRKEIHDLEMKLREYSIPASCL